MEGVGAVTAVPGWVGKRADDREEFGYRSRPAVGEGERQGVSLRRADVEEVDVLPVDGGRELGERVEAGLLCPPVERRAPVLGELLQVVERDSVVPPCIGELVGPASAGKPVAQVVDVGLGNVDVERRISPSDRDCAAGTDVVAVIRGSLASKYDIMLSCLEE
jgi:hypothetical protein